MIEMVYKGKSKEKNFEDKPTIPKNIRQIGEVGKDTKVYLEDYAITYIHQVKSAVLLGEIQQFDNVKYIFVNGALEVANETFDDEAWEEIYREAKEYFEGRQVIGCYLESDEQPLNISDRVETIFRKNFPEDNRILVIQNAAEKEEAVFLMENGLLHRQRGYYIYYEKNTLMQEYMVAKNEGRSVEKEAVVTDKAIQNFRKIIDEKKEPASTPKPPRFIYTASTVLVLTILVIGVIMINNYDKMKNMESTLSDMALATEKAETEVFSARVEETGSTNQAESLNKTEEIKKAEDESESVKETAKIEETEESTEEKAEAETENVETDAVSSETDAASAASAGVNSRAEQASYTVKAGDTLADICKMYYGNTDKLEEICSLNGIEDPNKILLGQKIALP